MNDPVLQELVNKYEYVFNLNFLVYGELKTEEVGLLTKGLVVMITTNITSPQDGEVVLLFDSITEETAVLHRTYQGTSLNVIYACSLMPENDIFNIIEKTILDGLSFLRYKAEFKGMTRSVSHV